MPFSKAMQNAVLQAVFLHVCHMIISHHLWSSTKEIVTTNDLFYQISNATEYHNNVTAPAKINGTSLPVALNATISDNSTAINGTSTGSDSKTDKPFYSHELPRNIVLVILVTILEYYWQIWLERLLPARPRPANIISEKSSLGDDDTRDEEVVRRLIAQGKIRRASLSWWNTALKWVLDITAGEFWIIAVSYMLESLLDWEDSNVFGKGWKWEFVIRFLISSFTDIRPLASLIAFVIVPAQKRIVFVAGMQLATSTFVGLFINTIIPWLVSTEFMKEAIENMSEAIRNGEQTSPLGPSPRLGDEL